MPRRLTFRRLVEADLVLLHEWLQREHVRIWWNARETYEETAAHYLRAIEGREPTDLYVIGADGTSLGFIQTYLAFDYPNYAGLVGVGENVAGVDLLIADVSLTGQGLGTEVIRGFVRDVVFARVDTTACIADPDVRNVASTRAFEKAGFCRVREFTDPEDNETHVLMRVDRDPAW